MFKDIRFATAHKKMDTILNHADIQFEILKWLPIENFVQLSMINKAWSSCIQNSCVWSEVLNKDFAVKTSKNPQTRYFKELLKKFARQSSRLHRIMTIMKLRQCTDDSTCRDLAEFNNDGWVGMFISMFKQILTSHFSYFYRANRGGEPTQMYNILFEHLETENIGLSALGLVLDEETYILKGTRVGSQFKSFVRRFGWLHREATDFENLVYICERYEDDAKNPDKRHFFNTKDV